MLGFCCCKVAACLLDEVDSMITNSQTVVYGSRLRRFERKEEVVVNSFVVCKDRARSDRVEVMASVLTSSLVLLYTSTCI